MDDESSAEVTHAYSINCFFDDAKHRRRKRSRTFRSAGLRAGKTQRSPPSTALASDDAEITHKGFGKEETLARAV